MHLSISQHLNRSILSVLSASLELLKANHFHCPLRTSYPNSPPQMLCKQCAVCMKLLRRLFQKRRRKQHCFAAKGSHSSTVLLHRVFRDDVRAIKRRGWFSKNGPSGLVTHVVHTWMCIKVPYLLEQNTLPPCCLISAFIKLKYGLGGRKHT